MAQDSEVIDDKEEEGEEVDGEEQPPEQVCMYMC